MWPIKLRNRVNTTDTNWNHLFLFWYNIITINKWSGCFLSYEIICIRYEVNRFRVDRITLLVTVTLLLITFFSILNLFASIKKWPFFNGLLLYKRLLFVRQRTSSHNRVTRSNQIKGVKRQTSNKKTIKLMEEDLKISKPSQKKILFLPLSSLIVFLHKRGNSNNPQITVR